MTKLQPIIRNSKQVWEKQLAVLPWTPIKQDPYNIKKAVIAYLQTIPWTYYLTGGTRYELTLKSMRRTFDRWFEGYFTENHQTGMRYWHPGIKTEGSILFWVAEKFEVKDGYHGHGLLYLPDALQKQLFPVDYFPALINQWQRVTGNPDRDRAKWNALNLKHYDKKRGAGGYCAKYVFKDDADYDLLT
jgi:hypothetical protein